MAIRSACASALLLTAGIHAAVVPEHLHEWPAAGVFFVALAAAEVVLAAMVLSRPNRQLLVSGAAISVASALLWLVSRTIGLPIGPEAFTAEAIAAPDVVSTALEAMTALLLAVLLLRQPLTVAAVPSGPVGNR